MVVLRCTQTLLVRLKRPDVSAGTESTTLLGDWYGNILRIEVGAHRVAEITILPGHIVPITIRT
jgi:hypothetical protein